jgi:hypothetical protein
MQKIFLFLFLFSTGLSLAQQKPQTAFIVKEKDLIPEGIAFDPGSGNFYLSSIQKRKIVLINKKGEASDFVQADQDGILSVLGMKVDTQGRLWACNNTPESDTVSKESNIHVYEKNGKLFKVFKLNDGNKHLFNDLHFLSNGDTYVTDSEGGSVYVIRKGSDRVEEFIPLKSLGYPNGIAATPDEKKLLVVTGSGLGIVSIDLENKKIASVAHPRFMLIGFDGLYTYKNTLIGIQNNIFPESVIRLYPSSDYSNISKMEFVTSNEPQFDTPTTGVISGDYLYFIANSQLFQIIGNRGSIKNPQALKETLIMKIKLN